MEKEICYRVVDGKVLVVRPTGSTWSALERGDFEGATLKVVTTAISAVQELAFHSSTITEDGVIYNCSLNYLDDALQIVKGEAF